MRTRTLGIGFNAFKASHRSPSTRNKNHQKNAPFDSNRWWRGETISICWCLSSEVISLPLHFTSFGDASLEIARNGKTIIVDQEFQENGNLFVYLVIAREPSLATRHNWLQKRNSREFLVTRMYWEHDKCLWTNGARYSLHYLSSTIAKPKELSHHVFDKKNLIDSKLNVRRTDFRNRSNRTQKLTRRMGTLSIRCQP